MVSPSPLSNSILKYPPNTQNFEAETPIITFNEQKVVFVLFCFCFFLVVEIVELTQSKEEPLRHEPKSNNKEKLDIYCHTGKDTDLWTKVPKSFRTANVSSMPLAKQYA